MSVISCALQVLVLLASSHALVTKSRKEPEFREFTLFLLVVCICVVIITRLPYLREMLCTN